MPQWNGNEYHTLTDLTRIYQETQAAAIGVNRMSPYVYRTLYEQLRAEIPQFTIGTCFRCQGHYRVYREDMQGATTACRLCSICPTCVETYGHIHCGRCANSLNTRGEAHDWACRGCYRCQNCAPRCPLDPDQTIRTYHCAACCGLVVREEQFVRNYNDRNYPASRPSVASIGKKPFLWLGVELEVEVEAAKPFATTDGPDHWRVGAQGQRIINRSAKQIIQQHALDAILKHDSSIHHGFEVVTGPFSLQEHKVMWPGFRKDLLQAGCRAWEYENTGLHVHMSRNWFSSLDLGKALVFVNSDKVKPYITAIAGRDQNHYTTFQKKKATDLFRPEGRYEALNLTNAKTVEMRIFKATLSLEHILADIEFCHALASWVKEASMREVESWDTFYRWVLNHRKDYQHVINYFTRASLNINRDKETE